MKEKELENPYNIFRIPHEKINLLKNELVSKGLTLTKSKKIKAYTFSFYFSSKPPETQVKWLELYKDFLPKDKNEYNNRVYFASLVIEKEDSFCYAISLGTAHFYISKYADSDFGLDLAERIARKEIKEKYTKYFFSNRNQSVIKFRDDNDIEDSEIGEYFQHIKSATIDSHAWGKTALFGASVILKLELPPTKLITLITKIDSELKKPERVNIPRVKRVKDKAEIQKLESLLKDALNSKETDSLFSNVVISNKDFLIENDMKYSIYLFGNKDNSMTMSEFNMESVRTFTEANSIDLGLELNKLKICIEADTLKPRNESLRNFIDFISDEYECLLNGRWHRFNTPYLQQIDVIINKILIEYNSSHDFNTGDFEENKKTHPEVYAEMYFNKLRQKEGYINKDRFFIKLEKKYTVELMDLYKDKSIYFVKMGSLQKLGYVIDQAANTLNLFKNNKARVILGKGKIWPKRNCLWLILDRKTKIQKLSDLDSLIFKWKLAEWYRLSHSVKILPVICINYKD